MDPMPHLTFEETPSDLIVSTDSRCLNNEVLSRL